MPTPAPAHTSRSIMEPKTLLVTGCIVLAAHVGAILIGVPAPGGMVPLGFVLSSVFLSWCVLVVPVAALRGALPWHDPLVYFFALHLATSCVFFWVWLAAPDFVRASAEFGGHLRVAATEEQFLHRAAEAQFILALFLLVVLLVNRRASAKFDVTLTTRSARAAAWTGAICGFAGIVAFVVIWRNASFVQAVLVDVATDEVRERAPGEGRYFILQSIGIAAFPLLLFGLRRLPSWFLLPLFALPLFPFLAFGSRIQVIGIAVMILATARALGFVLPKHLLVIAGSAAFALVLALTLLRSRESTGKTESDVAQSLISGSLAESYLARRHSTAATLLLGDRVRSVALVVQGLEVTGQYMYGESLLAGPANTFATFSQAAGFKTGGNERLLEAHEQINLWRFHKRNVSWNVPPSFAGEFYMQFGYTSLAVCSVLFALLFRWLRAHAVAGRTVFRRWAAMFCAFSFASSSSTQVSYALGSLSVALLGVSAVYLVCFLVLPAARPRASRPDSANPNLE